MNESELESELRRLQPTPPRLELEQRIATALVETPAPMKAVAPTASTLVRDPVRASATGWSRFLPGLGWACAGAAAAAIVLAMQPAEPSRVQVPSLAVAPSVSVESESLFEPEGTATELLAEDETEIVFDESAGAAQIYRTSSLERYSWTNPTTGARIEVEMPREDLLFIPVSYQ